MDETMPEEWRPDRTHLYVYGKLTDECLKISVDPEYPESWKIGRGAEVVSYILNKGFHLLVVIDKQINFLNGAGKKQPEKLIVDWLF